MVLVSDKELCLNRLPVEYQADAAPPIQWLKFLDELVDFEDILTLQEYIGYLPHPFHQGAENVDFDRQGRRG